PHNVYPCRGEDRWIAIVVSTDTEWQALDRCMGNPAWAAAPDFETVLSRWQHRQELDQQLAEWTADQDAHQLMDSLQSHGVPAGAVLTAEDLVGDPHLKERGFFQEFNNVNCPHLGSRTYAGRPFRTAEIPMVIKHAASLGEHNQQVLRELAGLSQEEIDHLHQAGVIADRPKPDEPRP
ncbi:MAG: CoA transferase, partial [Stenotrophomonas maltophilia]